MTHDEAFLAAIRENPRDDAPRLIYADWLEERNDPRGEFIRVQCALAKDPDNKDLDKRNSKLIRQHGTEWAGDVLLPFRFVRFYRGFAEVQAKRRFRPPALLGSWSEAFLPTQLQFAAVTVQLGKQADIEACLSSPLMARVNSLHLYLTGRGADLEMLLRLAKLPVMRRLEMLYIGGSWIEDCEVAFAPLYGSQWKEVVVERASRRALEE